MSLNWPKPNHNHASEYQVSGWPFVTAGTSTGTASSIVFPQVTQWFQIRNTGGTNALLVGFTSAGVDGTNYMSIPPTASGIDGMSPVYNIKCKELWVKGSTTYTLIAGLTNVTGSDFPAINSSNGFVGVG